MDEATIGSGGSLEWMCRPCAVYDDASDKTFFAYLNQLELMVNYFDHAADSIGIPVVVASYEGPPNDHNAPTIEIVPAGEHAGKILVFFAFHNGTIHVRRSANAKDTSVWGDRVDIDDSSSYPKPFWLPDGTLWLSYRRSMGATPTSRSECYRTSPDCGDSWSERTEYIHGDATETEDGFVYAFPALLGGEIHVAWTHAIPHVWRDVYHIWSSDGGTTWQDSAGSCLALPATQLTSTRVFASARPDGRTWMFDIILASPGDPRILFVDHLEQGGDSQAQYGHVSNGQWVTEVVGRSPGWPGSSTLAHYPNGGAIDPSNPDQVVLVCGDSGAYGVNTGRLEVWQRSGGIWARRCAISANSGGAWFDARPQFVKGVPSDAGMRIMWTRFSWYGEVYFDWVSDLFGAGIEAST